MSTQQSTSANPEAINKVSKSLNFWLVTFIVAAFFSLVYGVTGNPSLLANIALALAAGMVVLRATKRQQLEEKALAVRVTNE